MFVSQRRASRGKLTCPWWMHVVNSSLVFFHAAIQHVSLACTGRACYRTDARRPRRRTLSTGMARRSGDEHRVPLGDITNTQTRGTGSNKRSKGLEGGEYCIATCPCPYFSKPLIAHLYVLAADPCPEWFLVSDWKIFIDSDIRVTFVGAFVAIRLLMH